MGIQLSPEQCLERIKKRDRNGESTIGLDLMTKLHEKHEKLFVSREVDDEYTADTIKIEIIDGSQSVEDVCRDAVRILDALQEPDEQVGSTSCPLSQEHSQDGESTDSGSSESNTDRLKL